MTDFEMKAVATAAEGEAVTTAETTVGVIGGADGPTEVIIADENGEAVTTAAVGGVDDPNHMVLMGGDAANVPIWLYFLIVAGIVVAMSALAMAGFHALGKKLAKADGNDHDDHSDHH